jgi:hypothetical protein
LLSETLDELIERGLLGFAAVRVATLNGNGHGALHHTLRPPPICAAVPMSGCPGRDI